MKKKIFSIIIPCFNCRGTIKETLESVKKQPYTDELEVIICDDRSTDKFTEIVDTFRDALDIRYFCTKEGEPKGPANARNLGIVNSEGEWLIFLDSDDRLSDDALANLMVHINKGEKNFIWCPFRHNFSTVFWESRLALQGKCFNRKFLLENHILFNNELYTEEDYNFIMKVVYELECRGIYFTHDKENIVCEHIDNDDSMVHTIENYIEATYRYFLNGYSEPSLTYATKFPQCRGFLLRETMFVFIMMYYRYYYVCGLNKDKRHYFKRLLEIMFLRICQTYNINKDNFIEFLNDNDFHTEARHTSLCDMGVGMDLVISQEMFNNDFGNISKVPFFSIVIPCFNCEKTIDKVLDSIVAQGFDDVEVIICDDRSDDRFMDIVKRYNDRLYIRYFRTEEGTMHCPGNARQVGLDNANGEWVVFMDSDDRLVNTALKDYCKCVDNGAKNMIWGGFSKGDALYCHSRVALHGKAFQKEFLKRNNIRFNTHIFMEEDYDFIQKVLYTIEGTNDIYYIWEKEFYIYTVESETSSMSSVGNKYFEKTYESFLQSRFNPIMEGYLRYPNKNDYFERLIYYSICLCYFRYLYFVERNDANFILSVLEKNRKYIKRASSLLGEGVNDIVRIIEANDEIYNNAMGETLSDMGVDNFNFIISFEEYLNTL